MKRKPIPKADATSNNFLTGVVIAGSVLVVVLIFVASHYKMASDAANRPLTLDVPGRSFQMDPAPYSCRSPNYDASNCAAQKKDLEAIGKFINSR